MAATHPARCASMHGISYSRHAARSVSRDARPAHNERLNLLRTPTETASQFNLNAVIFPPRVATRWLTRVRACVCVHGPCVQDPAEHFVVEECLVKETAATVDENVRDSGGDDEEQQQDGNTVPPVLLSFVQRYEDPDAMPTRWQARLEPPGMVGWWFTDADDDGVQDDDENGGTFTATRESAGAHPAVQKEADAATAAAAAEAVKAAKAEAEAAAAAAKVYLSEAEETAVALSSVEALAENWKGQAALAEANAEVAEQKVRRLQLDHTSHRLDLPQLHRQPSLPAASFRAVEIALAARAVCLS